MSAGTAPAGRPARAGSRELVLRLSALLAVLGAVDWRRGDYFTGSLDPVVVAKAVVSVLALLLAFAQASPGRRLTLGTGSLWWFGAVLGSAVWGALVAGPSLAGLVLAVRVLVLGCTVFFLLRADAGIDVLRRLAWSCGLVAAVSALTGLPGMDDGRLGGGIPAMDPNALALLSGVALIHVAWRTVLGEASWGIAIGAVFQLGVLWMTGSRTALLMVVLGVVVMALHVRRPRVGLVVGGLVLVAAGTMGALSTGAVTGFAERGGDGTSTLGSRLIAWRAALTWAHSGWEAVFGGGLSVKVIPVVGQYWKTQPLDSSWASLLVQTGIFGLLVAAGWVAWVLRGVRRAPYLHRVLFLGLWLYLVGRSLLESGLFDASPAFLLFLAVSLLAEGGSRNRLREEAVAESAPDGAPTSPAVVLNT